MNDHTEPIESLIQYLDGELHGDQLSRIEKEIDSDPSLKARLDNLLIVREGLKRYGLQQQIKAINREMIPQLMVQHPRAAVPTAGKLFRFAFRAAAALILLIGLGALYQYLRLSPGNLYKDTYRAYSIGENRGEQNLDPVPPAYRNGRMKEVITLFNHQPDPAIGDYFLAGNAFLQLDRPQEAVNSFLALQRVNKKRATHIYEEDAEYYLALSYLKNGRPDLATPLFEKIHSDPGHLYRDKVSGWFLTKLHWLRSGR
jgi:tetratricopeptide (TPR) repeat protein